MLYKQFLVIIVKLRNSSKLSRTEPLTVINRLRIFHYFFVIIKMDRTKWEFALKVTNFDQLTMLSAIVDVIIDSHFKYLGFINELKNV